MGLIADHTLLCADDCYRMTYPGADPYSNSNFVRVLLAAYLAEIDSHGPPSHMFTSQVAFFEMLVGETVRLPISYPILTCEEQAQATTERHVSEWHCQIT